MGENKVARMGRRPDACRGKAEVRAGARAGCPPEETRRHGEHGGGFPESHGCGDGAHTVAWQDISLVLFRPAVRRGYRQWHPGTPPVR